MDPNNKNPLESIVKSAASANSQNDPGQSPAAKAVQAAKDGVKEAIIKKEKEAVKVAAKRIAKQVAARVGTWATTALAASPVGWAIIVILILAFILLLIAVAIFAFFASGSSGNSLHQASPKDDPNRLEVIRLLDTNSPQSSQFKHISMINERDKEFLKNGGTRENPKLQPDQRLIDTLIYLAKGNEKSREAGFEGFGYVEVSHIVSLYEDMPINREKGVDPTIINSISVHKKGQAMDIGALGLVDSKCKCGEKIPVKVRWQDDPPKATKVSAEEKLGSEIDENVGIGGSSSELASQLMQKTLANELDLPLSTFEGTNLQSIVKNTALGGVARSFELPEKAFVGVNVQDHARAVFTEVLKSETGIDITGAKITGNAKIDNIFHQAARNHVLKEFGMDKLAQIDDHATGNEPLDPPAGFAVMNIQKATRLDSGLFNPKNNNLQDILKSVTGDAFGEYFTITPTVFDDGFKLDNVSRNLTLEQIEKSAQAPEGSLKRGDDKIKALWRDDKNLDKLLLAADIDKKYKAQVRAIINDPNDTKQYEVLIKDYGYELFDKKFNLEKGAAQNINNIINGAGRTNEKIDQVASILVKSASFRALENQYGFNVSNDIIAQRDPLHDSHDPGAKRISELLVDESKSVIENIAIKRIASQFSVSTGAVLSLTRNYSPTVEGRTNQFETLINSNSSVTNYLKNNNIPSSDLARFIAGDKGAKNDLGRSFATGQVATYIGLTTQDTAALMNNLFPTKAEKERINKLSEEDQQIARQERLMGANEIIFKSKIGDQITQRTGLSSEIVAEYFVAPKEDRTTILLEFAGGSIDKKFDLPMGEASKMYAAILDGTTDSKEFSQSFMKSAIFVGFENRNSLPYNTTANLFAGLESGDMTDSRLDVGYNILNTKLGLEFYDPEGIEPEKRFSIQNVINGNKNLNEVLSRTNYVRSMETSLNLEEGTFANILNAEDWQEREKMIMKFGAAYLDNQLTKEGQESPTQLFSYAINGQITNDMLFRQVEQLPAVQELVAKYNKYQQELNDGSIFTSTLTGLVRDTNTIGGILQGNYRNGTVGELLPIKNSVVSKVLGTQIMDMHITDLELGNTVQERIDLAKSQWGDIQRSVEAMSANDYALMQDYAGKYAMDHLETRLEAKYSTKLDDKFGQGTTTALKEGVETGNWAGMEQVGMNFAFNQLDGALGLPSGMSNGLYTLAMTGNPMALAMVVAAPVIGDVMSQLSSIIPFGGLGGMFGFGGCKGNTKCHKPTAQENVHTAVEQLLNMPEYIGQNMRVMQLITFSKERDVEPFAEKTDEIYGKNRLPNFGLFAMDETHQHLHIGF